MTTERVLDYLLAFDRAAFARMTTFERHGYYFALSLLARD